MAHASERTINRYYDPETGSFTTQDPAFASTDTAYTYAVDDPVNDGDLTGLDFTENLPEQGSLFANAAHANPDYFNYGTFNDFSTAAVNLINAIVTSPLHAAQSAYHIYGALYQAGQNGCSWSSVVPLILAVGLDDGGALGPIDPEADAIDAIDAVGGTSAARTFQTYTKINSDTGDVYVGRTSGYGTPLENLARRDASHAYNGLGFGPGQLEQSSESYAAIRGQEQQLIEQYQDMGISANKINGISPTNPNRDWYLRSAEQEFGSVP